MWNYVYFLSSLFSYKTENSMSLAARFSWVAALLEGSGRLEAVQPIW